MPRPPKQYSVRKDRYTDSNTGEKKESRYYYVHFRDHLQITRKLRAHTNKTASEYMAQNVIALVNHRATNQPLPPELRSAIYNQPPTVREKLVQWDILDQQTNAGFEPLYEGEKAKAPHSNLEVIEVKGGHVCRWKVSMETNQRAAKHVKESVARVIRVIQQCNFYTPADINGEAVRDWIATRKDKGDTASKINNHLGSFKSFIRWMLTTGAISHNPVQHIKPLKQLEKQRPRRALNQKEIRALLARTLKGPKHHGLTGYERSLIYRLALTTGLRYNEIYTLKRKNVIAQGERPSVTVEAENAKNGQEATLPLSSDLATDLQDYFSTHLALPHAKAFSGLWMDAGAKMLREDLAEAEVEYENEKGYADFHSLRHTFGTMLSQADVPPQMAQKLMRHSDINLTMGIYTHLTHGDQANAIAKLPPIEPEREVKTGTADVPEKSTSNSTENSAKVHKNLVKSNEVAVSEQPTKKALSPSDFKGLELISQSRPARLERATYGLEIR